MHNDVCLYTGAGLTFIWGVAHLIPTGGVVKGLGEIGDDNRHIIRMEWITEGVALMFIGLLVAAVTYVDSASAVSVVVYRLSAACLLVLAAVSLFTGFRIRFLPFRLCPFIFSLSAVLILIGAYQG